MEMGMRGGLLRLDQSLEASCKLMNRFLAST